MYTWLNSMWYFTETHTWSPNKQQWQEKTLFTERILEQDQAHKRGKKDEEERGQKENNQTHHTCKYIKHNNCYTENVAI